MDYEKEYKKLKEGIKNAYLYAQTNSTKTVLENILPELKESEGERIKKHIISYLRNEKIVKKYISDIEFDKWIAWLEKQNSIADNANYDAKSELAMIEKRGVQKSIWHNEYEEPKRDSLILLIMQSGTPIVAKIIEPNHTFSHGERWAYIDDLLEKQGKQKPDWSEEDEQHIDSLLKRLDGLCRNEFERTRFAINEDIDWLKSLKDRVGCEANCTTTKEWDEEDEINFQGIMNEIEANKHEAQDYDIPIYYRYICWLESIKQRIGG